MNNSIIDPATAILAGAAAKYGADLLADAAPAGADDHLRLARNLVSRLRISPEHGAAATAAVGGAIADGDAVGEGGLRAAVTAAVTQDPDLASDLAMLLSESGI